MTGSSNVASGFDALYSNTAGNSNTASGVGALRSNTTGSDNIAEGYQAGYYLTTGGSNIDIGNAGMAADNGIIRIGTSRPKALQTATYIAGIYNVPLSGNAVVVTPSGQLGVVVSSERFKTGITLIGPSSSKLEQLRPVMFHLKSDPKGALQYGLIAEEVAKIYPELVIRDEKGRIDGVRYDELTPMLLNEMQQQQLKIAAQDQHSASQDAQISQLRGQLASLQAALATLQTAKDDGVGQR